MPHNDDFEMLCRIEPRLRSLYERAKRTPAFHWYAYLDESDRWQIGMVEELENLVGHFAAKRDPLLTDSVAYDTAYHAIHSVLRPEKRFAMPSVEQLLAEARKR